MYVTTNVYIYIWHHRNKYTYELFETLISLYIVNYVHLLLNIASNLEKKSTVIEAKNRKDIHTISKDYNSSLVTNRYINNFMYVNK